MNRLFEALSEMEPRRKAADPAPDVFITLVEAHLPANSHAEVLPSVAEAAEPELTAQPELIPADLLAPSAEPLCAEREAEPEQAVVNHLPVDIFPNDMASLILVFEAEMDQMAVEGLPADLAAPGALFTDSEGRPEREGTAIAVAGPEFTVCEVPILPPSWEMDANLASIELQFTSANTTDEPMVSPNLDPLPPDEHRPEASTITLVVETRTAPAVRQELPEDIFPSGMPSLVLVLEPEEEERSSDRQPAIASPAAAETICEAGNVTAPAPCEGSPEVTPEVALSSEPPVLVLEPESFIEQFALDFGCSSSPAEIAEVPGESSVASRPSPSNAADSIAESNRAEDSQPRLETTRRVSLKVPQESRLVALTQPDSLGAEKFRALVTRLEHQHRQCDLKSFQVTSSVISEGKTLVSGNVAATLARHLSAKTLLVEGDLHRPTLATILGLDKLRGLNHWWSGRNQDLSDFVYKLEGLPLWFLPAGKPCDRPSDLLRSARFGDAFRELASEFEWTVVDSTPMVPIVDVNLWSRLVDGTLLVVREGVTPVKALKQGLLALDHPNLIGMVLNDATATNNSKYDGQYYGSSKRK